MDRSRIRPRPRSAGVLTVALFMAACGNQTLPPQTPSSATPATARASSSQVAATPAPPAPSASAVALIEQPPVPSGVPVAPDTARVDLAMPAFSNPTRITNPLFPVSRQESVLMLGKVDGEAFRTEVTLLPYTRIVVWEGRQIETAISQYQAYLDGRITEIAYDLYAQADDGSVWYFGEDVADFADGAIVTKEGTWLAGKDAPAAMIMPANPTVGDVFRTENSPGFAFEEVTVETVDQNLDGPLGAIRGGMVMSELHMDGATEDKTFAPGYGEFLTTGGGDVEALALAVPTDASGGSLPAELDSLTGGAARVFDFAGKKDWKAAASQIEVMTSAWAAYRGGGVPRLIEPRMTAAIDALSRAIAARDVARGRQAALEVRRSGLDLELRYRPASEVDLARFDLWAAQVVVDASSRDLAGLNGDAFTLVYIRDRILGSVDAGALGRINTNVLALQVAATDEDLDAAIAAAAQLRDVVGTIQP
jgi:hypothetical protein